MPALPTSPWQPRSESRNELSERSWSNLRSENKAAAIMGGAIGALALFAILAVLWHCKRIKKIKEQRSGDVFADVVDWARPRPRPRPPKFEDTVGPLDCRILEDLGTDRAEERPVHQDMEETTTTSTIEVPKPIAQPEKPPTRTPQPRSFQSVDHITTLNLNRACGI
ncbi:hypothetical protein BCR34DRAFT_590356 [Clohesyomyces aquaticus]|uniref:Uncharacterized protein n=1 Tax=Clohesyomyces aquaticus TaxID=1231657 RepID=A0A1Y1ZAS8_9PLEO|nr:hypothetical protein BCR34DRAFT_590356 [Clohesyomyces aquaticus]